MMACVLYHDHDHHDSHDDDHQAYYDGKNYDHRSIEQLRREAGLARPTRGNDDNDYDHDDHPDDHDYYRPHLCKQSTKKCSTV